MVTIEPLIKSKVEMHLNDVQITFALPSSNS